MDVNLLDQAGTGMQRNSFQIAPFNAKYELGFLSVMVDCDV
jgi:hypothetical protein